MQRGMRGRTPQQPRLYGPILYSQLLKRERILVRLPIVRGRHVQLAVRCRRDDGPDDGESRSDHDRPRRGVRGALAFLGLQSREPWWRKRELVTDLCYWFFVPVFSRVFRIGLLWSARDFSSTSTMPTG
jgi:hypothetical protein